MSNEESINKKRIDKDTVKKEYKKEKIRELRERLGLRRTEFGAKIGYSYQQVLRVEEGINQISDELAEKISREFQVSVEWLAGEEDADAGYPLEDIGRQRGRRLRQAYEESGLSQREFAKRTHTSGSMLTDVLSGRYQMTIRYAQKIEAALGIGSDWLLYGDEDAKDYPCGEAMVKYLKKHPDIRKEIWEGMQEEEQADKG